ncbi:hypothetical protein E2C01_016908 [Portunus trituberculatus]|uniref:Uncharacterized protein n=1 Tax=Portunus trituberculatus TaxID=210409 RepID=A0A5B7DQB2_PORTR|nr:hypothetical protein [Portunus trituberculatus]
MAKRGIKKKVRDSRSSGGERIAFLRYFRALGAKVIVKDRVETKEELPKKVRAEEAPTPFTTYDPMLSYMWRCASMVPPWTAAPLVTRDGKPLPPPPPAFVRDSVPAPLPAYLSQGPPVLADPGRVVPLSDSQKFERHYQPNVALAPPKVRDKTLRNSLPLSDHCHDVPIKHQMYAIEDCIKRENSPTILPCSQPSSQHSVVSKLTQTNNHYHNPHHHHHHLPRKLCSPDTSGRHPELELSTTDSDTDSVGSLANHSETVEEAEGLLRGWSDRAAAGKVRQLVANLVADLAASNRQKAALKQRMEAMTRDHSHAVVTLQSQILASTQLSKESQFREKLCVMEEELRVRPTHSVITPISPVKTEPSEVIDTTNVALKCRPGSLLLLLLILPPGTWAQAAAADPWLVWLRVAAPHQLNASHSQCWVGGGCAMISARTHRTGLTWCYATAACRAVPLAVHGAHVQKSNCLVSGRGSEGGRLTNTSAPLLLLPTLSHARAHQPSDDCPRISYAVLNRVRCCLKHLTLVEHRPSAMTTDPQNWRTCP